MGYESVYSANMQNGLKLIALIKAARGTIALALAVTLFLGFLHGSSQVFETLAANDPVVLILRLTEVVFIWFPQLANDELLSLSLLAFVISLMRFSEAVGIWFNQSWAEWLAVLTGFAAAVFFIYRLVTSFDWAVFTFLIITVLVILYLLRILAKKKLSTIK